MTKDMDWAGGVRFSSKRLSRAGLLATSAFILSFGVWATLAPLAGAAVAPGVVTAAGRNQKVQHLEGGVVDQVLVHEGDTVLKGQVLLILERTAAEADRDRFRKQVVALKARAARLMAERDGLTGVTFSQDLRQEAGSGAMMQILTEQDKEFTARLQRHRQEGVILRQRVAALNGQIDGLLSQETAIENQIRIVDNETQRKQALLAKGLTNRSEYTSLLRSQADLVGTLGQLKSSILGARTQIVEAEEQSSRLETQRVETAATQINDVRTEISNAEEQLKSARVVLERREVRAPSNGVIVSMAFNFKGAVVRPGEPVLELLPTERSFVVEARISPRDIDAVSVGKQANVRFVALNARTTPEVPAQVSFISADRLVDERSQQPYYLVRMNLAKNLPAGIRSDQIYPGMPVESYVGTGERTFLEYLLKPLDESLRRAFQEE